MADGQRIRTDLPVRRAPEVRVGLALPIPLSMRLDQIRGQLDDLGFRVSRKDLMAIAVLTLPSDCATVLALLDRYRSTSVGDVLTATSGSATVQLRRAGPGPRPSR